MSLRKWVQEKWVDIGSKRKDGSFAPCGRSKGEKRKGYPKCVPLAKARSMSEGQRRSAVTRKRAASNTGPKPTNVSTFVKKAYTDLNFNIICEKQILNINGVDIEVPASVVNISIGAVKHFDDAGIGMINGIIATWNQYNPTKLINEPYRFENFDDMMAFRKNNI